MTIQSICKPKGFFSYARVDDTHGELSNLKDSLSIEIRLQLGDKCDLYQDTEDVEIGQNFPREIQKALDESDFLIIIMTPSYFKSEYCRLELKYFLDREKRFEREDIIIPIYYISCGLEEQDNQDELIEIIKKRQYFDWRTLRTTANWNDTEVKNGLAGLAERIIKVIKKPQTSSQSSIDEQQLDEIVNDIKTVLDVIQLRVREANFRRLFRAKVIRNVLKETNVEIEKLCGPRDEYVQDLSLQESFIIRAGEIFEEADNLCAISIDELSQFWVAEDQRTRAQEYTARQPKKAKRLFVFSNFENAAKYRNVMAAHDQQYGKTGGVFFCSKHTYLDFLKKRISNESEREELKNKDFAVLVFEDEKGKDYYESTLSSTKLVCRRIDHLKSYQDTILDYFEKLTNKLKPGEIDKDHGFIRYESDFQHDDKKWGIALSRIFDTVGGSSTLSGSIYHLVFISKDVPEKKLIEEINNNLRSKLIALNYLSTQEKLIEDLWFGKRSQSIDDLNVKDGIHKG